MNLVEDLIKASFLETLEVTANNEEFDDMMSGSLVDHGVSLTTEEIEKEKPKWMQKCLSTLNKHL